MKGVELENRFRRETESEGKQRVCHIVVVFKCYRFPHVSGGGNCSRLPLSLCSCSPMVKVSLYCI